MAAPRFLALLSGRIKQVLTITTSAGAGDADKVPATNASGFLDPTLINGKNSSAGVGDAAKVVILDSNGRISTTMMPVGVDAETKSVVTSENLAAGNLVNIYNNAGTPTARKADATAEGKECHGFVLAGTTSPASAIVYLEGTVTGLSALTPGAREFLNTTAGGTVETAPSTSGNVVQCVGIALSATELSFEPQEPITIA
jgi:hypothetical protein